MLLFIGIALFVTALYCTGAIGWYLQKGVNSETPTVFALLALFATTVGIILIIVDGQERGVNGKALELSALKHGEAYELVTDDKLLFVRKLTSENATAKPLTLAIDAGKSKLSNKDFPATFVLYYDKQGNLQPADAGKGKIPIAEKTE